MMSLKLQSSEILLIGFLTLISLLEMLFRQNVDSATVLIADNVLVIIGIGSILWLRQYCTSDVLRALVRVSALMPRRCGISL